MNPSHLILLSSLVVLLLGAWAWRLTGSYAQLITTTLASYGLLFAAGQTAGRSPLGVVAALMCAMLLAGRFYGTWWRSRRQTDLRQPAQLMGATAALAFAATLTAYWAR